VTRDQVAALLDTAMREAVQGREEQRLAAEREAYTRAYADELHADELHADDKDADR
jgi:hypothetical protein